MLSKFEGGVRDDALRDGLLRLADSTPVAALRIQVGSGKVLSGSLRTP